MNSEIFLTGAEAGLSGEQQIKIALRKILSSGGVAQMEQIYTAVEDQMNGKRLSKQGKDSLRFFINSVAVKAGYLYPHDKSNPGWRITQDGQNFIASEQPLVVEVIDTSSNQSIHIPSNASRGDAFERYILELLPKVYPNHTWYHQGKHKHNERGLDFIGDLVGVHTGLPQLIGVQVKFHAPKTAPTQTEWLKFLAGCFNRGVDLAIFITTGELTGEQMREASEAKVKVIKGRNEINRLAVSYNISPFQFYDIRDPQAGI